jgi:hypothetical protein
MAMFFAAIDTHSTGNSQDLQKAELRMQMSNVLLWIRDSKGDEEVDAAPARIAALPDVVKGEQN